MKSITIEDIVRRFSLEVLAGEDQLHRKIEKSPTQRPGLEFIDYFDFFQVDTSKCSAPMKSIIYID